MSAKGSNFKEDDRALLLYISYYSMAVYRPPRIHQQSCDTDGCTCTGIITYCLIHWEMFKFIYFCMRCSNIIFINIVLLIIVFYHIEKQNLKFWLKTLKPSPRINMYNEIVKSCAQTHNTILLSFKSIKITPGKYWNKLPVE